MRADDDAGITLIELILSMVISLIVLGTATTFFVGMLQQSSASATNTTNTSLARVALDSWSSLLSVADSPTTAGAVTGRIASLTSTNVVFYADINNRTGTSGRTAPTEISLTIANGQLTEQHYAPTTPTAATSTYPTTPTSTIYLAGCLKNSSSACITATGQVGSGSAGFTGYTSCATGLCALAAGSTAYDTIVAVGISFTMTDPHGGVTNTFSTIASLPAVS